MEQLGGTPTAALYQIARTPACDRGAAEAHVRAAQAARLLAAEVGLAGVTPQKAQALPEGGVATGGSTVKGTRNDSIAYALSRR